MACVRCHVYWTSPCPMCEYESNEIEEGDEVILQTQYVDEPCEIYLTHYAANNQPAIRFVSLDGEPLMMATVCLPHVELEPGQTIIKDYSENKGVLDWFFKHDLCEWVRAVDCGFNIAHVVQLNMEALDALLLNKKEV